MRLTPPDTHRRPEQGSLSAPGRLIEARAAETDIPAWPDLVGNYSLRSHLEHCLGQPRGSESNVLVEGFPGTGKTSSIIAFMRRHLNNPSLYTGDDEITDFCKGVTMHSPLDAGGEVRYMFIIINGATDSPENILRKINLAMYSNTDHAYLLVDELGELYHRGLEAALRVVLTHPEVSTFAAAQSIIGKRSGESRPETERRSALLRRFASQFQTENPTEGELIAFLKKRLGDWALKVDDPSTLRLIAKKSGLVVGFACRPLIKAINAPGRRLTRDLVERMDLDPSL